MDVRVIDIIDVLIVAYLMFLIYKLFKGTLAFNIFIGVAILYVVYLLVTLLEMKLLAMVLGRFAAFGVIILIIIFQPEVRRFLLLLGDRTLLGRLKFLQRFFKTEENESETAEQSAIEIVEVLGELGRTKTGALLVFVNDFNEESFKSSGQYIDAQLNAQLLKSIFHKESPLHDGAVIIFNDRIKLASAILPVSENNTLPKEIGLRHRAGVGITENTSFASFIVSEETGSISYAINGELSRRVGKERLLEYLKKHLSSS